MENEERVQLVVTLGDPAGIGPEVVMKALALGTWGDRVDLTVMGDRVLLDQTYDRLIAQGCKVIHPDELTILEIPGTDVTGLQMGVGNAVSGDLGFRWLDGAIAATLSGQFEGIVTAPIAKSAWKQAGHLYPGQTEVLAQRSGCEDFGMAFVGRSPFSGWVLRTLLATTHIPLQQVPIALTPDGLTQKLALFVRHLVEDFGLVEPTIAIAGLNPHSGEMGQLGMEEVDWMNDWLGAMRSKFPQVKLVGLLPPDTMWVKPGQAWFRGGQMNLPDGFLALYHDQGLIPVKLMAFDRAVNTTIGLPFVRTSPDHGTAFDIAGQGVADATSMVEAIEWAIELVKMRRERGD